MQPPRAPSTPHPPSSLSKAPRPQLNHPPATSLHSPPVGKAAAGDSSTMAPKTSTENGTSKSLMVTLPTAVPEDLANDDTTAESQGDASSGPLAPVPAATAPTAPTAPTATAAGPADVDSDEDEQDESTNAPQDTAIGEWDPAYVTRLTNLCHSDKSENEIWSLAPKEMKGVHLLELRLTTGMADLVTKYNNLHGANSIKEGVVKARTTAAAKAIAKENKVPVEDLQMVYNSISTSFYFRKKRNDPSAMSISDSRRIQEGKAAQSSSAGKGDGEYNEGKGGERQGNEDADDEGADEAPEAQATQPAITPTTPTIVPRLEMYHPIMKHFIDRWDLMRMNDEQVREIISTARQHTFAELRDAVNNSVAPDRKYATALQVRNLVNGALEQTDETQGRFYEAQRALVRNRGSRNGFTATQD